MVRVPITCTICGLITMRHAHAKYCSDKCKGKMKYVTGIGSTENQYKKISGNPRKYLQRLVCARSGECATLDEVMEIYHAQNCRCAMSGIEFDLEMKFGRSWRRPSLDQIIPSGGYHKENIRIVCCGANFLRNNMSDADVLEWCKKVAEFNV